MAPHEYIRNLTHIEIRCSCGHSVLIERPDGTSENPAYCLCYSCHPQPWQEYDTPCFACKRKYPIQLRLPFPA